ncbi:MULTISPECIES: hypothetical protein [unclassified Erwinia]|uniref:hypothetical protein n=1 Tax=unclassified Erwinia TaxID=2622719 RepID=UPI0006F69012|nr:MULTISPECIES: hypothetical protein [unclassified Erwinia]KQN53226.1 hypothetical protein ASF13_16650 [Erwinia sp. Leaf53]PLV61746.1 hypothetical protein NV64_08420 [Erwinia sp. B116]
MSLIEIGSAELKALGAFPLSFDVEERVSGNAQYRLDIECRSASIDFDALLGKKMTRRNSERHGRYA